MGTERRPGERVIRREHKQPGAAGRASQLPLNLASPDAESTLRRSVLIYLASFVALALTTALLALVRAQVGLLNAALVYLIVVIAITVFAGRRAGIAASLLGFLLFNFFQVPPYYTLVVSDLHNILALFVFLGVSLLLSWLIAGAREQARQAQRRAEDVARLYELSQAIIGSQRIEEVLLAVTDKVRDVFDAQACWILLPRGLRTKDEGESGGQQLALEASSPRDARPLTRDEMAAAEWAFRRGESIEHGGRGVAAGLRPRGGGRVVFTPLRQGGQTTGVLATASKIDGRPLDVAERTVLATFADQAAVALDRLALMKEAQRAEMLARTDELKSALMSALSHDLRTPLASIMASVTSLMDSDIRWDEETKRDFLQGILDEAERLNRLVGNLLDMSRIEGGALRPEKDWYSIGEVIEAVVQRIEPRLAGRPVAVDLQEDLPLVRFDFTEIEQVLTNLVENAANYTPPGTPITITARRDDDRLEVSVEDEGPGVAPEHMPHLFDKFYRVAGTGHRVGTGLGLAIASGLVQAHGGQMQAANRASGGLRVTFTLPLEPAAVPVRGAGVA
jgi:two-component system sensor histidine kinase KdpD